MAISAQAKAALATLKQSETEGVSALAATLESELEAIDAKNYAVIGEKRVETSRKQTLEQALAGVAKALGVEGDTDALIANTEAKAQTLASERNTALAAKTDLETKAAEASAKLTGLETKAKRDAIAQKAKIDPTVFADLFSAEDLEKFEIAEDGAVSFDKKPLLEHVQADERLKRYESALFNVEAPAAPGAPPGEKPEDKTVNPALAYIQKAYQR